MERLNSNWCIFVTMLCQISVFVPMGLNAAALNPTTPSIKFFVNESFKVRYNGTSSSEKTNSLIVHMAQSLLPLGAAFGALTTHLWLKFMSRRTALVVVHILSLASAFVMSAMAYFLYSYELLIIGRWISGVARGVSFSVGPLFVAEITHRKTLALYQSTIGWLILLSGALENIVAHPHVMGGVKTWPFALAFPGLFSLAFLCFLPLIPHTVPYMIKTEQKSFKCGAKSDETDSPSFQLLRKLRCEDTTELLDEYASIKAEIASESEIEKRSVLQLLWIGSYRHQMVAVVVLQLTTQATGTAVLLQYTNAILTSAGVHPDQTTYYAVGIFSLMTVTMIIVTRLLERFGSKKMLVTGLVVVVIGQSLLCLSTSYNSTVPEMGVVGIVSVAIFSIGVGTGPLLTITAYPSEITTIVTRPEALWLGATCFWVTSSIAAFLFPISIAKIHGFAYLPFIVLVVVMNLYIVFFVPETHNRSVTEIQNFFGRTKTVDDDLEGRKLLSRDSDDGVGR